MGCRRGVGFEEYFLRRWCLSCKWENFRRQCEGREEHSWQKAHGPHVSKPSPGWGSLW